MIPNKDTMVPNTAPFSGSAPPNGPAGGDLAGTYPNPTLNTSISTAVAFSGLAATTISSSGNLNFSASSGTNRNVRLSNLNSGIDNISSLTLRSNGTGNAASILQIVPLSTGFSSALIAQFSLFATDFVADSTNFSAMLLRATSTGYTFNSTIGGTGTQLPFKFQINATDSLTLNTNGSIGIGSSNNTFFTSPSAATLQLGPANAASPVAQTLQVQNAATGNNNGAATFTHIASLSVGNGTSGDHVFSTGKNGNGSGVLATVTEALRIKGETQAVVVASGKTFQIGNAATTGLAAGALAATTNASIVITDSSGQAYRIPCII